MEKINHNPANAEYQINNTKYHIKSTFREAQAERLEDKIGRLILKEQDGKSTLQ